MLDAAIIWLLVSETRKAPKRRTEESMGQHDGLNFRSFLSFAKALKASQRHTERASCPKEQNHWPKRTWRQSVALGVLRNMLLKVIARLPNNRHFSIPNDNRVTKTWGLKQTLNRTAKDHTAIGKEVGIEAGLGAKISGSRFGVLRGPISGWSRSLVHLMLETQKKEHRYDELSVPSVVSELTLYQTGHLPKFQNEMFQVAGNGLIWYLIPTSEVVLVSSVRGVTAATAELPLRLVAASPCFRLDRTCYGRNNRGLLRQRQFDKVELMQIVPPTGSYRALDEVLRDAEVILQKLRLHYRILDLGAPETGLTASKTFDIEIWFPSFSGYKEASSCSNTESYQAARLQAKCQLNQDKQFVHAINGSGLAVGRTLAALLENNQRSCCAVDACP